MFSFTVKVENEQDLIDLEHTVAKLFNLDVTKMDRSTAVRYCLTIGRAYLSSVEEEVEPSSFKKFWVYVRPTEKAWFKNLSWGGAKEDASKEQKARVIEKMMRRLRNNDPKITIQEEQGVEAK